MYLLDHGICVLLRPFTVISFACSMFVHMITGVSAERVADFANIRHQFPGLSHRFAVFGGKIDGTPVEIDAVEVILFDHPLHLRQIPVRIAFR